MRPRTSVAPRPAASSSSRHESSKPKGGTPTRPPSPPPPSPFFSTSRVSIRAGHEVRVVLLVERHGHLNRISVIAALEPRSNRIDLILGATILTHETPHVPQPMTGAEHPERTLAEHQIDPQRVVGRRPRVR